MSRTVRWLAYIGLASPVLCVVALTWQSNRISPAATALRDKFQYVSLQDRLDFETARAAPEVRGRPVLLAAAVERLERVEQVFGTRDSQARMLSLQNLHSSEVNRFINSPGFGFGRMGRLPGRDRLDYSEPDPISLADISLNFDEQSPGTAFLSNQRTTDADEAAPAPSFTELDEFHLADQIAFTDPWSFGDVKDRGRVAGFVSHGFGHLPAIGDPTNRYPRARDATEPRVAEHPASWKVARLELVSLLKFEEPTVYVSDNLPQMKELAHARTRPLTEFEQQALATLRAGEDIVTRANADGIEMLGSLRAAKQCLNCHAAVRGELLGAFSYRLQRGKPLSNDAFREQSATF